MTVPKQADSLQRGAGAGRRAGGRAGVSLTVLLAALPLSAKLTAERAAEAIAAGMTEAGLPEPDIAVLDLAPRVGVAASGETPGAGTTDGTSASGGAAASLEAIGFEQRMRAARAVVIIAPRLDERTLLGSLPFEIATRCRQAGVPAYAITRENALHPFDARILDLQVVIEARSAQALRRAGVALAEIV